MGRYSHFNANLAQLCQITAIFAKVKQLKTTSLQFSVDNLVSEIIGVESAFDILRKSCLKLRKEAGIICMDPHSKQRIPDRLALNMNGSDYEWF